MRKSTVPVILAGMLGMSALAYSCKKHEVTPSTIVKTEPPALITYQSPTSGTVVNHGDSLHIKATITAPKVLHGYEITIRATSHHDSIVYHKHVHDHATAIEVDQKWCNLMDEDCDMSVDITAAVDHDGNTVGKRTAFKCKH